MQEVITTITIYGAESSLYLVPMYEYINVQKLLFKNKKLLSNSNLLLLYFERSRRTVMGPFSPTLPYVGYVP